MDVESGCLKENMVSDIGRACLIEIGCKSRCRHICSKSGLLESKSYLSERSECEWNGKSRDKY